MCPGREELHPGELGSLGRLCFFTQRLAELKLELLSLGSAAGELHCCFSKKLRSQAGLIYSMLWGCRRDGEVTLLILAVNCRVHTCLRFKECCCAIALQEMRIDFLESLLQNKEHKMSLF